MKTGTLEGALLGGALALALSTASAAEPIDGHRRTAEEPAVAAAPEVHTLNSHFARIVVVRLKNQADMLEGLKTAVAREKVKNAVILSGAGSLVSYHVHVVGNTTLPATLAFIKDEGPFDLLTTTGYIIEGRVHAHITFADTKKTLGGHLEPGTRVFTFAIITLGVLEEGTSLERFDDSAWH